MSILELNALARELRVEMVRYSYRTKTPHLASCLSCVDLLVILYFRILNIDPVCPTRLDRDFFILSKGHAAPALFQVLARRGFFDAEQLAKSCHDGTDFFGEHPPARGFLPGNEFATGSLGHGLPLSVGIALGAAIKKRKNRVFCLLGDGECNEGSVWEAAALAGTRKISNLVAIVDCNDWQGTDRTKNVLSNELLFQKWSSFGWAVSEVSGHDFDQLTAAIRSRRADLPTVILARTIKGKGVSFMEDDNNWHYKIPSEVEVVLAQRELEQTA